MDTPTSLVDRLRQCAALWAIANEATVARLGRAVVNDGGFFSRIDAPGASVTTATLEKFAAFLCRPSNWVDGIVPAEAVEFVQRVVGSPLEHVARFAAPQHPTSTGQSAETSGAEQLRGAA